MVLRKNNQDWGINPKRRDSRWPASSRGEVDLRIEQKLFLARKCNGGGSLRLTERTRNASYNIELKMDEAYWLRDNLQVLSNSNTTPVQGFKKYRSSNDVLSILRVSNNRGSYLEITKLKRLGSKQTLIVPSGQNQRGWKLMAAIMRDLLTRKSEIRSTIKEGQINVRRTEVKNQRPAVTIGNPTLKKQQQKQWNKALIITKSKVTTTWEQVRRTLGRILKRNIVMYSFQANKAVWWPAGHAERSYYSNLKKCFLDERVTLSFEEWKPESNAKESIYECCNSWVKLFGVPWHLWSEETFRLVGDRCGGLLDISTDTLDLKDLAAAKIKVRGNSEGYIQSEFAVQLKEGCIDVRVEVENVDLAAYEQGERQTYAQVVANGAKAMAGGGLSEYMRGMRSGRETYRYGDNWNPTESTHNSGQCVVSQGKLSNACNKLDSSNKSKAAKFLKKVEPKEITSFRTSTVKTLEAKEQRTKEGGSQVGNSTHSDKSYEVKYCRRKNTKINETVVWPQPLGVVDMVSKMDKNKGRTVAGERDS